MAALILPPSNFTKILTSLFLGPILAVISYWVLLKYLKMASALKVRKELESKVYEALFKNLYMLTLVYPPSETFKKVFKQDMFIKNNTAGFQQVVYYLLNILDTDKLKQIIPYWPLCDTRAEINFRNDIMRYINELNTIHVYANIPQFATSQLISPGGFKFVKFMFTLSQFVLFEHLKRNSNGKSMLYPLKPSKETQITIGNLEKLTFSTKQINEETNKIRKSFENQLVRAKLEAENINNAREKVKNILKDKTSILKVLKQEFEINHSNDASNVVTVKQNTKEQLNKLTEIKEKLKWCEQSSAYLNSDLSELKYEKTELPSEITRNVHFENGELDLATFLKEFSTLIELKRFELHVVTDGELHEQVQCFSKSNNHLSSITKALETVRNEQSKLKKELEKEQEQIFIDTQAQLKFESFLELSHFNSTQLTLPLSPS